MTHALLSISTAIYAGIIAGLVLSISVGPVIFAIIKYSIFSGFRAGMSFVFGVSFSDLVYVALIVIASTYMEGLAAYAKEIGIGGSIIFMVMGITGLVKKVNVFKLRNQNQRVNSSDYFKIWLSGFLLNMFNPGALIMWLGINVTIIAFPLVERIVFFVAVLSCILLSDVLKVFLAGKIGKNLTPRNSFYLNRISSVLLIVIGIFVFCNAMGWFTMAVH